MVEYVDYAEYYDAYHDTQFDVPFYLDYARQCGPPILELACGTGRILIPIAEAGFDVYGVDLSENMIELCRRKVAASGLSERVRLTHASMANFDLGRADFRLAYIPYRSFMHLYTQTDQLACLHRAYDHLSPGGLLIIDVYTPNYAMLAKEADQPFTVRGGFDLPNGHHVVREDRFVGNDPALQIQYYELRFQERDEAGTLVRERTLPLDTRYTFRYEMQLLLERVGFEVIDLYRDYERNPYDGTGEIISIARRSG